MADPRQQKLAKVLVHYSLRLKPGDTFVISSSEIAAPLVREVYREALAAGAFVSVDIALEGIREILLRAGNDEQLAYISDI
nr:aminopeptidase [Ktedonobacteraceae bacterium]